MKLKNIEVADPNEFFPLRLMTSWNRAFSIFYITFADLREINHNWKNLKRTKEMVKLLSINWTDEKLRAPYIKEIAPFFNENYMYPAGEESTNQ